MQFFFHFFIKILYVYLNSIQGFFVDLIHKGYQVPFFALMIHYLSCFCFSLDLLIYLMKSPIQTATYPSLLFTSFTESFWGSNTLAGKLSDGVTLPSLSTERIRGLESSKYDFSGAICVITSWAYLKQYVFSGSGWRRSGRWSRQVLGGQAILPSWLWLCHRLAVAATNQRISRLPNNCKV